MAAVAVTMEDEFDDLESQIHAATAEIRVALRLTRRAAETELHMALELTRRVPAVIDALDAGLIDNRRARAIVHGTTHLDDDTTRHVVAAIIDDAPRFTTGQLVARLRKLCIDIDPPSRSQTLQPGCRATGHPSPSHRNRHHRPVRHPSATAPGRCCHGAPQPHRHGPQTPR